MVGLVGGDAYGARLLEGLARNGVDHRYVGRAGLASGLALCHVADDGAVVIEFLHGPALVRSADETRVRRAALPSQDAELLRISRTSLDESRNVMEVTFELLELHADGTFERWLESQTNRYFTPSGFAALLERAGLALRQAVPAYRDDGDIDDSTFHVLALATPR